MKFNRFSKIFLAAACVCTAGTASAQINLGDLLNKGVSAIQNATATSKFEATDLIGTWTYVSPAVSFKGDNALSNIGGAAGATVVEDKLAPYYKKVGFENSQLTVNDDLSFTWKIGGVTLTGTIEKTDSSNLVFNFAAFKKVKVGKVECIATKSGSTVNLTFDSTKLLNIMQKISSISSSSTFKTVNSLLSNYKDMYLGVKMKK